MNEGSPKGRVVVWGFPLRQFGGITWQALHYVEGLKRLGFDVWYVEDRVNDVVPTDPWDESYNFDF